MNAEIRIDLTALLQRFLRYVRIGCASSASSNSTPGTESQEAAAIWADEKR